MRTPHTPVVEADIKPPQGPVDWRNGVVARAPNWLGDALMCMPALLRLKEKMPPGKRLWVATPPQLHHLWAAAEWIDGVVDFQDSGPFHGLPGRLRKLGAGAVIVFPNSTRSALEARLSGIPLRIGRSGRMRSAVLNCRLPAWSPQDRHALVHQVSHYFSLVGRLAEIDTTLPQKTLRTPQAAETVRGLGIGRADGYLAIAPGAAYGPAKQWPVERFAAVAEWFARTGGEVVVVGMENDIPAGAAVVQAAGPGARNLCGKTSLQQLMAVLQCAGAAVANDSGAMHLAAALGTPGVAVFGSTNPAATGPLGATWFVLRQPPPCAPCFQRTCPLDTDKYRCLTAIQPEAVCQALAELRKN
jgi:heptosyltransferase-2